MSCRQSLPTTPATTSIAGSPRRPGTDVTVADVAEEFGLHPNVARMHLSKLEQAGFLATGFRRAAGGGRPAKLYRLSDKVVTFGFPPRRYELLSRLALDSLSAGGTRDDAMRACREAGVAEGRRALAGERRAAARPRGGGRPRRADHRGAGPAARGGLAGRLPQRGRQQLQLPRALRRRPRPRVRHASGLPRGHHPGGHRWPGPPRASIRATAASAAAASAARCCAPSHRARSERSAQPGSVRAHPHPEDTLTIDEAIRDLLDVSTDIASVAVVDGSGAVVAAGPAAAGGAGR